MVIQETKTKSLNQSITIKFNLDSKKAGSMLECPILITKDGVELTQSDYDIASQDVQTLTGPFEVTINLTNFINSNYNGDVSKFISDVTNVSVGSYVVNLFDVTTNQYQTTTTSSLDSLTGFIDSNCIIKVKPTYLRSFYFNITTKNNALSTPSKIVADLQDKYSILLQGVTALYDTSQVDKHRLMVINISEPEVALVDFSTGVIPSNATNRGAKIDSTSFPGENVLAMVNSGINNSYEAISIPIELSIASNVGLELYISTEKNYDKVSIYLDSTKVLYCSGNTGDIAIHDSTYDTSKLTSDSWCKYLLTNVPAGSHIIKIEYSKDSSDSKGKDNVFVRKIYEGGGTEVLDLYLSNNMAQLNKNSSNILSTSTLAINQGKTFDLLLSDGTSGLEVKVLQSDGTIVTANCTQTSKSGSNVIFNILDKLTSSYESNCLLDAMYVINKELTDTEKESILKGTEIGFKRSRTLTGAIFPSTSYKLTGTATLYINDGVSRVVTGDFTTTQYENYIVIDEACECTRA